MEEGASCLVGEREKSGPERRGKERGNVLTPHRTEGRRWCVEYVTVGLIYAPSLSLSQHTLPVLPPPSSGKWGEEGMTSDR